ncbi:LamG-like jellyroll fold domain-containing protein [Spirosoma koreense]
MKTTKFAGLLAIGLLTGTTLVISCKKSDDGATTLPPIGGFNNSNEVASTNLLAHWTFDGTNNEDISKTAPSNSSNATFTTGQKGQALQLNAGYLVYPIIAKLNTANAIPSVSVSAWINTANNGKTASSVFALTRALSEQTDWNRGPINMYVDANAHPASSDTLQLHAAFHSYQNGNFDVGGDNVTGFGLADAGKTYQVVKGTNKWVHFIMVYDGANSTIDLYANNVLVSNSTYRKRDFNGTPTGNIVLPTPTQVLIGGWPSVSTGYTNSPNQTWQGLYTGSIDEIRVYNKALSTAEIGALYQLESAGR